MIKTADEASVPSSLNHLMLCSCIVSIYEDIVAMLHLHLYSYIYIYIVAMLHLQLF